ncbi:MAG TPA: DUF4350 domain-containing protein [bacterium]|jgi:hypothetical protein
MRYWPTRLLPLSLALLASSWVYLVHIYLPPEGVFRPFLLITLAFLFLFWRQFFADDDLSTAPLTNPTWATYFGLAACVLSFLFFPYPYNIGLLPLAIGWLGLKFLQKPKVVQYAAQSLLQLGLFLVLCAALLPLIFAWGARVHDLSGPGLIFTYVVGWLLRILGQPVEFTSGALLLRTFEDPFPITITAEKLFPVPLLLFALLWSFIILWRGRKSALDHLLVFWLIFFAFAILRVTLLIFIMLQRINPGYFWEGLPLALSVILLALIIPISPLSVGNGRKSSTEPAKSQGGNPPKSPFKKGGFVPPFLKGGRGDYWSVLLGIIFGAWALACFTFRDPGTPKSGRLMINEHGSDWEWTTELLDTSAYSEKTTYNYYCLAEYLKYHYDLKTNTEPLTPEALRDIDVLILKIPTQPYAPSEIDAVVNYVRQGGSLWVIGDHTNVFGSSSFFNPLLRRFGYSLNFCSTHDLRTGNLSLYEKPGRFAHPSVVNLPAYLFATSCSMNAPWSAESAILGYGLRADHLDYSQKNFFPDRNRKGFDMQFGLLLQQAAGKFGSGRLLIYTDSTTFSNFFIFVKGKPELVLGSLEWLNRRPHLAWLNTVFLLIALLALASLIYFRFWNGAVLGGILLGALLAGWIADSLARINYPLPQPRRAIPFINFEREHSNYFLPTLRLVQDSDKRDHLTFYVWTQRVGAVPRQVDDFDQAVSGSDPLVMIDPSTPLGVDETSKLHSFLQRGGRMLLISSADNGTDAPGRILTDLGLKLQVVSAPSDTLHTLVLQDRFFPLAIGKKFASLSGGEVFWRSDQGEAIGVTKDVGKGRLYALSCGHLFRNSQMGQTSVQPDEGLKALYRIEFELIQKLLK